MADNPHVVALLAYFAQETTITRPEVSKLLGKKGVGYVAGIHHRDHLKGKKEVIGQWPSIDKGRKSKRRCQFPIGTPLEEGFHLCGATRNKDPLVCDGHIGNVWIPPEE